VTGTVAPRFFLDGETMIRIPDSFSLFARGGRAAAAAESPVDELVRAAGEATSRG